MKPASSAAAAGEPDAGDAPGDARVDEELEAAEVEVEAPPRTGQRIGDYTVGARLGRGAAGEVYRAEAADGRVVAMKILRRDKRPERQELRFRRELRAIARLDHPHVLRVLGEGRADDGALYMLTELATGGDLRRMVGVAALPDLLVVLLQVASALDYVHSQRIVHRDLKPENVLLFPSADGPEHAPVAKLADFGIAWLDPGLARPMTQAGRLMGTVDFVSPEQVQGQPADPRSDLYALGVMAFELYSGRVPFEGSVWQVLQARVQRPAPSLVSVAPDAPPGFAALVDRLLATDPRDRPQSAHLVCNELAALLAALPTAAGVAERLLAALPTPTGAFLYRPPVVGRAALVDELVRTITRQTTTAAAGPTAIALVAEPGAGKSEVVRLVTRALASEDVLTLTHALGGEATRPPFAPFEAIERDLAARAGAGSDVVAAPGSQGSWLVARRFADTVPREAVVGRFLASDDAAAWRRRRVRRVLELMRALPTRQGRALIIEDVHEMDGGAWALLQDLLGALAAAPAPRPFVLVSARPAARERLLALAPAGLVTLDLAALTEADVRATVAAMLGTGASGLPEGLVARTLEESGGNPLLVVSYLLALAAGGQLRRVRGGWVLGADARAARLPTMMANVLRQRLALLAPATQDVLGVAAAIGPHFDVPLLLAAADASEDAVLDALDEALRAGVLESTTEVVETAQADQEVLGFTHKRLVEVLYDELDEARRRRVHDRVGQALLARGEASPAVLSRHLGAGSDDALAIRWLEAAADESAAAFDHAASQLHLERLVHRLAAAARPAAQAREALGDALLAQGKGAAAVAVFAALQADATGPAPVREAQGDALARARWLRKEGLARCLANDTSGGIAAFERALATLGDRVPRSRLAVRWAIVRDLVAARLGKKAVIGPAPDLRLEERMANHRWLGTLFRWVDLERVAAHSAAQLRLAERSGDLGHRTYAYAAHAVFWAFLAAPRRAAKIEAATQRLAEARHDDAARGFVELMRAATALLGEQPVSAIERFDRSVALVRRAGDRLLECMTLTGRAWASTMLGRWRQADEDFAAALATAEALDIQWMKADAGVGRSLLEVATGHHTDGVARARALAHPTDGAIHGLPAVTALATEILGGAEYMRGRYKEAAAHLSEAATLYHRHHLETGWGYLVHVELSESLTFLVDRDGQAAVPDLVKRLQQNARRTQRTLGRVPLFRGFDDILAGVVAARKGQRDKALALFDRGRARRVGPLESYLDTWVSVRVAVERLRLGGARGDAARELDRVAVTFEANGLRGMSAWLGLMRAELGL